jgi:Cys-tRNA(Pro) deacylase
MCNLARSADTVQKALAEKGHAFKVVQLDSSTRTAHEAAVTIGCEVAHIVKSLVFKTSETHQAILVLVSGSNHVNQTILAQELGEKILKADADFVRAVTGFAIGGIPPLGHKTPMLTFIDEDLLQYSELWAAAGTPNAVFKLHSKDLARLTRGTVITLK